MDSVLKQLYFVFAIGFILGGYIGFVPNDTWPGVAKYLWPIFGAAFLTVGLFICTKIKK